tara:strand:- start:385 stop:672 length:288 start_codon:yes stop_codon:yes gene_type:complete
MQRSGLKLIHENNPPDGFLEYRRGLHPPPEDLFSLGGGIFLLPDVVALFSHLLQSGSQTCSVAWKFTKGKQHLRDFLPLHNPHSCIAALVVVSDR